MTIITLSDDQARIVAGSTVPIIVQDPRGRTLGKLSPLASDSRLNDAISPEALAEVKLRMANDDGARFTTAEVMAQLRAIAPE
jgi:hypothetical protein